MYLFKRKFKKSFAFDRWLNQTWRDSDKIFPPHLDAQSAVNFLREALLPDNFYVAGPLSTEQINTIIVNDIIDAYAKGRNWRKQKRTHFKYTRGG